MLAFEAGISALRPVTAEDLLRSTGEGRSAVLPPGGTRRTSPPGVGFLSPQPEHQLLAASVQAECSLAPRLAGWPEVRIRPAVAETLDQLGLADTAGEHPYDLRSPRRRLAARAAILAANPDLLLLDEPTAALDSDSRKRLIQVIWERSRRGKAVLAITHDAAFAHEALQRGIVLERGHPVYDGPIRGVIDGNRKLRPAALVLALARGLPAGEDRRHDVACILRLH